MSLRCSGPTLFLRRVLGGNDVTFTYNLPPERIAQRPLRPYDRAKLLVVDCAAKTISESVFSQLPQILSTTELLVLNQSGVITARLFGHLDDGREVEVLLISNESLTTWQALARPARWLKPGVVLNFSHGLRARVIANEAAAGVKLEFIEVESTQDILAHGIMPIPPYIRAGRSDQDDLSDYQTPFAKESGSVAAPTASLHFTSTLLDALDQKGVRRAYVTLHLGAASFLPLDRLDVHGPPATERYHCSSDTLAQVRAALGGVIAVGTSVVRALESAALNISEQTSLFIKPGHRFNLVDGLITNFHQPGTTHLELVEALIGHEMLERAYNYALEHDFRFLSYGDAMFIKPNCKMVASGDLAQ